MAAGSVPGSFCLKVLVSHRSLESSPVSQQMEKIREERTWGIFISQAGSGAFSFHFNPLPEFRPGHTSLQERLKIFIVPKNKRETLAVSAAGTYYYLYFTDKDTESLKHSNKFPKVTDLENNIQPQVCRTQKPMLFLSNTAELTGTVTTSVY